MCLGCDPDKATKVTVSMLMRWHHKSTQWLSTESQADRPWKRTHLAMQGKPEGLGCGLGKAAISTVSTFRGTQPSSSSKSAPALPPTHFSLVQELEHTSPEMRLPQRQRKSQVAAQPPQILQPQCPDPQPYPTPHHCIASDLG